MLPEQELPVQTVKLVWLHFKMRHPEMAKTCRIYVHVSATLFVFEFCTRFGKKKKQYPKIYEKPQEPCSAAWLRWCLSELRWTFSNPLVVF